MKRFTIVAAILVVLAMACAAVPVEAADFSGKWTHHRMFIEQDNEKMDIDLAEGSESDEELGYLEFRDGKIYILENPGDDEKEIPYKVQGDKLVVDVPDEEKESGLVSYEFIFEGDDLVGVIVFDSPDESGTMKNYYRKPK